MRAPPGLLGAGLIFWGWATGMLWLGIMVASLFEARQLLGVRWEFSQADLDRVWNLCVALFLGATIYVFVANDNLRAVGDLLREDSASSRLVTLNQSKRSLFQLLQWLPLMFLPLALAQLFGAGDQMDMSTFSWWLRRKRGGAAMPTGYLPLSLNVTYPYFACCLFGACAANQRTWWFPLGLTVLVTWALWAHRSRSFAVRGWLGSLILALALGVALLFGMFELQRLVQRFDEALLTQWTNSRGFDVNETQTRIGAIGRLELSSHILWRVQAVKEGPPPLLRQASYDSFKAPFWNLSRRDTDKVTPESNLTSWILHPAHGRMHSATIAGYLHQGNGPLALPSGTAQLDNMPSLAVVTNLFGAVRVEEGPGLVQLAATYENGGTIDSPPSLYDQDVPLTERHAIDKIATSLDLSALAQQNQHRALQAVERFFSKDFTYSLWQDMDHAAQPGRTALARFLLENHSGHCEYFATATVLLLRAAGIPARYATGFAVLEKKGHYFVVRERHAHAWCLAWIDGRWQDIDTTPGTWSALEASRASNWEPVRDFFSRLWFEVSRWRWGHAQWKQYAFWLIAPLLAFTLARLFLHKQWRRSQTTGSKSELKPLWPGADSEFYAIERRLSSAGFPRAVGETGSAWLKRLAKTSPFQVQSLPALLAWHYRLRFDPQGLSASDRARLRSEAQTWLEKHAQERRNHSAP